VRIRPSSKRPCELGRGEVRRVSQNRRSPLVGYHVCCPRCGFLSIALEGSGGLAITEGEVEDDLSFSRPLRCLFCRVLIHLTRGELELEEDESVRSVQYR
jgi:hypothetical protein